MSESRPIVVAVDAVGGDNAPAVVLEGVAAALSADSGLHVVLTGPAEVVEPFAAEHGERVRAVPCTEIIEMGEHPATAVRNKRDSSIVVGARLVRDGEADAFFSAGSTGGAMAAATLIMGRIKGVQRPAIVTVIPTAGPPCVLLDVGANADCKPENLLQFAQMGSAYATVVLGVIGPRVALLNIGEEPSKGSQLAQAAHELMSERIPNFIGNVEGNDVLMGVSDVIVTDGFTGNVAGSFWRAPVRCCLARSRTPSPRARSTPLPPPSSSRRSTAFAAGSIPTPTVGRRFWASMVSASSGTAHRRPQRSPARSASRRRPGAAG